jgi:hypothetical protein
MTRHQAIEKINETLRHLPEERLQVLAELAETWLRPTAYASLGFEDKADIDAALDELDAGRGVAWDEVKAQMHAKLRADK